MRYYLFYHIGLCYEIAAGLESYATLQEALDEKARLKAFYVADDEAFTILHGEEVTVPVKGT